MGKGANKFAGVDILALFLQWKLHKKCILKNAKKNGFLKMQKNGFLNMQPCKGGYKSMICKAWLSKK